MRTALDTPDHTCANCGAALEGRYCHVCGQDSRPGGRVGAMAAGLAELASLDLRLPRSLLILAWPGELARRFADGRRAPYVPPLRLAMASSLALLVAWALRLPEAGAPTLDSGLQEDLAFMAGSASFIAVLFQLLVLPLVAWILTGAAPRGAGGFKAQFGFVLYLHAAVNGLALALIALSLLIPTTALGWLALAAVILMAGPWLGAALKRFNRCSWLRLALLLPLTAGSYLILNGVAFLLGLLAASLTA